LIGDYGVHTNEPIGLVRVNNLVTTKTYIGTKGNRSLFV
jgi:hypothetical protein